MTQPFYQEQQSSQQSANQQMLLCPVRLVYETQILVQPGEQIQPNQTIFINPTNPPPWLQNRPQNQVLYVQQMAPNNYIPQLQQQAGQNQLYMHQNYNNVQQIVPQQIVTQPEHTEVRSANFQITNVLQRSTAQEQTLQPNTGSYNPNLSNEAPVAAPTPNFAILPHNFSNVPNQKGQNQVNFNPANGNKQIVSNAQLPPRPGTASSINLPGSMEMHQNVYRPKHHQTFQHGSNMASASIPQSITIVPIQSGSSYQNPSSDNNTENKVAQIRPVQLQITNAPRLPHPEINTVSNYTNERIAKKVATVPPKAVNNPVNNLVNAGLKNVPTFSYRPIQPRPKQQRNMTLGSVPANNSQIMTPSSVSTNNNSHIMTPNSVSTNNNSQIMTPSSVSTNNNSQIMTPNSVSTNNNSQIMTPSSVPTNNNSQIMTPSSVSTNNNSQIMTPSSVPTNNNSQIMTPSSVPTNKNSQIVTPCSMPTNSNSQIMPPIQSSNMPNLKTYNFPTTSNYIKAEPNVVIRKRKSKSPDEVQNKMIITNITRKTKTIPPEQTSTTYNSIGVNTVPVQKSDNKTLKIILKNPNITVSQTNEENKDNMPRLENQLTTEAMQTSETEKLLRNTVFTQARNRVLADKQEVIITNIAKVETKANDVKIEPAPEQDMSKDVNKDTVKKDNTIKEPIKAVVYESNNEAKGEKDCKEPSNSVLVDTAKEIKVEKSIKDYDSIKFVKEINLLGNSKSHDQNGFVLTHVLDGYVIQESNIAFPIRKPLKEKTLQPNVAKTEDKKEEPKTTKNDPNDKMFNLSLLQINEADVQKRLSDDGESEDSKDNPDKKENPFKKVKSQDLKTWTVEQLTSHLSKYHWDETVSVLREHEIDGESLFLVSKNQLMTIGVNEDHAGVICDFVKN